MVIGGMSKFAIGPWRSVILPLAGSTLRTTASLIGVVLAAATGAVTGSASAVLAMKVAASSGINKAFMGFPFRINGA